MRIIGFLAMAGFSNAKYLLVEFDDGNDGGIALRPAIAFRKENTEGISYLFNNCSYFSFVPF